MKLSFDLFLDIFKFREKIKFRKAKTCTNISTTSASSEYLQRKICNNNNNIAPFCFPLWMFCHQPLRFRFPHSRMFMLHTIRYNGIRHNFHAPRQIKRHDSCRETRLSSQQETDGGCCLSLASPPSAGVGVLLWSCGRSGVIIFRN